MKSIRSKTFIIHATYRMLHDFIDRRSLLYRLLLRVLTRGSNTLADRKRYFFTFSQDRIVYVWVTQFQIHVSPLNGP